MIVNALTNKAPGIVNRIVTPVKITNPVTSQVFNTTAIWDTGATNCTITATAAKALGLVPVSKATVNGVHGPKEVNVYFVTITLNNENITLTTQVTETAELSPGREVGMLVGMNIISKGDFCITNHGGHTVMTFRVPSIETVDYVADIAVYNRCLAIHNRNVAHHFKQDKCACGSGKDFKNCHGKGKYNQ